MFVGYCTLHEQPNLTFDLVMPNVSRRIFVIGLWGVTEQKTGLRITLGHQENVTAEDHHELLPLVGQMRNVPTC